jgi:hypothetical protein
MLPLAPGGDRRTEVPSTHPCKLNRTVYLQHKNKNESAIEIIAKRDFEQIFIRNKKKFIPGEPTDSFQRRTATQQQKINKRSMELAQSFFQPWGSFPTHTTNWPIPKTSATFNVEFSNVNGLSAIEDAVDLQIFLQHAFYNQSDLAMAVEVNTNMNLPSIQQVYKKVVRGHDRQGHISFATQPTETKALSLPGGQFQYLVGSNTGLIKEKGKDEHGRWILICGVPGSPGLPQTRVHLR